MKGLISEFLEKAVKKSEITQIEDESYCGRIQGCDGLIVFADSEQECLNELQLALEDWLLMGIRLGHQIPIIDDIDLSKIPEVAVA